MTVWSAPQIDYMQKFGYLRVGDGKQKDDKCNQFMGHVGCLREDLHRLITLDGVNHAGKVFIRRVYHSCDRPECPVCFRRWAIKQADRVEQQFKPFYVKFGSPEHIIVSCPVSDYSLPYEKLKVKALKAAKDRGFIGGFMIFHAQRYHRANESLLRRISSLVLCATFPLFRLLRWRLWCVPWLQKVKAGMLELVRALRALLVG